MCKHNVSDRTSQTIDPYHFLELDKLDILYKLTCELGYPDVEALLEIDSMTTMPAWFKPLRC